MASVAVLTCLMALATGFGALPFLFCGCLSPRWTGAANALACGVMLAASFDLVHEVGLCLCQPSVEPFSREAATALPL